MLTKFANLWDEPADARCITTNGFVKNDGTLVMGAGCAGEAQIKYPGLPAYWGDQISKHGYEHFYKYYGDKGERLLNFTVKHAWYEDADIALIERSAIRLMALLDIYTWKKVLLPRPGCGNGHLNWDDVRPIIEPILDDRVIVVHNKFEG